MKKMAVYMVETENESTVAHWNYFEDATSAQDVVNKVRMYMGSDETVKYVYKLVEGWK